MIAIATILPGDTFGGISVPVEARLPPVHLTWHVAAAYDWGGAYDAVEQLVLSTVPFEVIVEKAQVFSTDRFAVVAVPRRSDALSSFHDRVIEAIAPHAHHIDQRYARADWIPHITLASGLSQEDATALALQLGVSSTGKRVTIGNVAFLSVEYGRFILSNQRKFGQR